MPADLQIEVATDKALELLTDERALSDVRRVFLEALAINAAEVLSSLERDVLPVFKTIPSSVLSQREHGPETIDFSDPPKVIKLPDIFLWRNLERYAEMTEVRLTRAALMAWAEPLDLNVAWIFDAALQTLADWSAPPTVPGEWEPIMDEELRFYVFPKAFQNSAEPPLTYQHASWLIGQTWNEYEQRELRKFNEHLSRHKDTRLANGHQLRPQIDNYDHFTWLALAYGKRMNLEDIADLQDAARSSHILADVDKIERRHRAEQKGRARRGIEYSTVRKAVHSKADLLGLPRLKTTKGRPRGSKSAGKTGNLLASLGLPV